MKFGSLFHKIYGSLVTKQHKFVAVQPQKAAQIALPPGKEAPKIKKSIAASSDEESTDAPKGLDAVVRLHDALGALSKRKQLLFMEMVKDGISGKTPQGLQVSARTKKEMRRFEGMQEKDMVEWIRGFGAGEVFYDIGANVGSVTLTAAALHRENIRIVAFEPSYSSFESLVRNLSLNGFLNFTIPLQLALLDRTGLQPMNYNSTAAAASIHAIGEPVNQTGERFTPAEVQMVPTYALDDLIELLDLPRPTRIKIDVDGYEEKVLRGAARTIAAGTAREIALEVVHHANALTTIGAISAFLQPSGYEMLTSSRHSLAAHKGSEYYVADYVFRHRDFQTSRQKASNDVIG